MYAFVRGPLLWIALIVFVFGVIFQIWRFVKVSRSLPRTQLPGLKPATRRSLGEWIQQLRLTILYSQPVMIVVTTIFHILLLLLPLFVLGHNVLLDIAWGYSLPSLPENVGDVLTMVVLAGALFFLCRRLFLARVRAITTLYDYVILAIAAGPFLTGFLAYHQIGDYDTMILLHMLFGEIMLMAIPFTKLVHMVYFFINRFILVHENTFGRGGSRVWS